jgi:hypothetical protein
MFSSIGWGALHRLRAGEPALSDLELDVESTQDEAEGMAEPA